ncbi:MAG: hypothetical protein ACREVL_16055 [Solimonas sp.]
MSFHFFLYRAPVDAGPLNRWERMHAEPLGTREQVRVQLDALFAGLHWDCRGEVWSAMGPEPLRYYLDFLVGEEAGGQVRFIVMNKAPPSAMRAVLEACKLNTVAAPEAGDLVDVYAYDDEARYYAKKAI